MKLLTYLSIVFTGLLLSCGQSGSSEETSDSAPVPGQSGVIEYEITYPYQDLSGFAGSLAPTKMVLKFKDGKYMTVVSKGKMMRTTMLCDTRKETLELTLESALTTPGLRTLMNRSDVEMLKESQPPLEIIKISEGDSLLGQSVSVYRAKYLGIDSLPPFEVVVSNDLDLTDPNWFNNYADLHNILLRYEMDNHGLVMRFEAVKMDLRPVSDEEFELEAELKDVPFHALNEEVKANIQYLIQ